MPVRQWAAWLVAPALLAGVAVVQWREVAAHDQSAWSGVGFGMFATFEEEARRRVVVTVELDGRDLPARIPTGLGDEADDLRTVPSAGATQTLADALAALAWRVDGDRAIADPSGEQPGRVVVVVQGLAVDGGDRPVLRPLDVERAEATGS